MSDALIDWVQDFPWNTALIVAAGDGQPVMGVVERVVKARAAAKPEGTQSTRQRVALFAATQQEVEGMHVDATMHGVEEYCNGFAMNLEGAAEHWYGSSAGLLLVNVPDRTRLDATVARWLPNLARYGRIYIERPQGLGLVPEIERGVMALARSASARLVLHADEAGGWLLGRSVVTEKPSEPPKVGE